MDDSPSPDETPWDRPRLWLIGCCVLAVIAAGVLLPAFASGGIAGSPLERILPGEHGGPAGVGGDGGGLGALNPGSSTGVGGDVGLDSETFASTSTATHFVVESEQPAYWRTATYDRYTGAGWEQTGEPAAYDGAIEHRGVDGDAVAYELTLQRAATAVPTVYRPRTVSGPGEFLVTDGGAVQTETPMEDGTTVRGVSDLPQREEELLRAAGTDYPDSIRQRYTQLPADTPDRLRSLTADLTADAGSPYEKAVTIQEWLRSEKEYDLGASRESDNVADTFVFEMQAGYCEYFANAMAVMLRSEGIPARYVVGYTTGQQVGEDTYRVRGMNAHAWVEVYFPDAGWVRFDPTPGDDRLSAYESALSAAGEDPDLREIGSPGEVFEPGGIEGGPDGPTGPVAGDGGYSTALNRTAVPGVAVEVTVTQDDAPVEGATVLFNGDPVGKTTTEGVVTGTVPDADELRIEVIEPGDASETRRDDTVGTPDGGTDNARPAVTAPGGRRDRARAGGDPTAGTVVGVTGAGWSVPAGSPGDSLSATAQNQSRIDGGVHPIQRTATIQVTDDLRVGEEVSILVRVGDVRLDDARVSVDGEAVATTTNGAATIPLPDEPANVTVAVERGSITGERTITVPALQLSVERGAGPPLPGRTVTVVATLSGEPAAGATVEIDGEAVATTDSNGTATVTLPFDSSATVAVSAAGQRRSTTVSGMLRNAVLFGAVLLCGLVGLGYGAYTRRGSLRQRIDVFPRIPALFSAGVVGMLVSLATTNDDSVSRSATPADDDSPAADDSGVRATAASAVGSLRRRVRAALAAVRRRLASASAEADGQPRQVTIREAWNQFLGRLTVTDASTRTPGELADHAVEEDGLPEQAVYALRDTFREVEYGARSPAERLDRVQRALSEIERAEASAPSRTDGGAQVDDGERDGQPHGDGGGKP